MARGHEDGHGEEETDARGLGSREIKGDRGRSNEIEGDPWRSREIKASRSSGSWYLERSREIKGDQGRSREIKGARARRTSSFCSPPSSEPTRAPISSSSSSGGERWEGEGRGRRGEHVHAFHGIDPRQSRGRELKGEAIKGKGGPPCAPPFAAPDSQSARSAGRSVSVNGPWP